MYRSRVVIVILFVVTIASLFVGSAASSRPELRYIALGDSVASGNALPGPDIGPCQRDSDSYPYLVHDALDGKANTAFHHLACSGTRIVNDQEAIERCYGELPATTRTPQTGWDECELKSLQNQVSRALDLIDDSPTLATITAGANDTGWTDPLAIVGLLLSPDHIFQAQIDDIAKRVQQELETEIARLLVHEQVVVILTDYYNPLNDESNLYELIRGAQSAVWGADSVGDEPCTGTDRDGNEHELSCAERFEYALQTLNASLASLTAIDPNRVLLASVIDRFRGHEAPAEDCGAAQPSRGERWIRGMVGPAGLTRPDCFHPNTLGAVALASAVMAVWESRDL